VFIVGISTAISTQLQRAQGHSNWAITQKAIWRSFKMAALGILVINPFGAVCDATQCYVLPLWDISSMRLPGVLQRIAMAYLITTLIVLYVPVRRSALSIFYGWAGAFHAIYGSYIFQWLVALVFPVIYIILTWGWDVPDCGRGHLSPTCNAAQYMDIQVFTEAHMYQGATCIPDCKIFDPEGIMGTLSAVLTCYMGVHIAHILQSTSNDEDEAAVASSQLTANKGLAIGVAPNKHNQWLVAQVSEKTTHMLGAAVVWAAIGITLHFTCEPINKNLWSLSYVFVMAATGTAVLWLFLMAVDAYGFKKVFSGFKWMGMNSIAIYVGSETLPNLLSMVYKGTTDKNFWWYGQQVIYSWCDEPVAGLLWSWLVALFWMGVGGILYWRRIFFKL
jgi:heparan-alpha-glucosaminide N-acetyltransferase